MSGRILFNATGIGASLTGLSRYAFEIARGLLAQESLAARVFLTPIGREHFSEHVDDTRLEIVPSTTMSPELGMRAHLRRLAWANALTVIPEDVYVAPSQLEARVRRGRSVLTIHDAIPVLMPRHFPSQFVYYRTYLRAAARSASQIITVSNHAARTLTRALNIDPKKQAVIANGVDHARFRPSPHERDGHILYVGRMGPSKNLELLPAMMRHIWRKRQETSIRLTLTEEQCRRVGFPADPRVEAIGSVHDEALLKFYRSSSVLVLPSWHEGFGLTPLEAMACGCPTVVTNQSSVPEVVGDASVQLAPDRPDLWANEVVRVLDDTIYAEKLRTRGHARSEKFHWRTSVEQHLDKYALALTRR